MRHVHTNPASKDRTPGQKRCRQFFEDDYKRFIALFMKMEGAHCRVAAAAATPAPSVESIPDEDDPPVEDLIEQLFADWEAEESGRTGD